MFFCGVSLTCCVYVFCCPILSVPLAKESSLEDFVDLLYCGKILPSANGVRALAWFDAAVLVLVKGPYVVSGQLCQNRCMLIKMMTSLSNTRDDHNNGKGLQW